jgi:single-stranded-DNA-specific exonuclease
MSAWRNPGLKALLEVAKGQGPASVFHAGFLLGPRINAGGRIGRSDLGARLLSTDDPDEAAALASELDALNASRKEVEREIFEAAIQIVERESNAEAEPLLLVAADGWHPGVIGIVASRLRERYRKPAIVVGLDRAANIGKGSGRSQAGVNLGRAVLAAYDAGLLLAGGGPAMAAGLSVRPDNLVELRAFLCAQVAAEAEIAAAEDGLDIDALVTARGADRALYESFQQMAPFGPGNPEPVFAAADVRIERPMALRGGHVRCTLVDGSGGRLKAVAWRAEETEIGRRLLQGAGVVHVVGRLKPDDWQGRQGVELEIEDLADPRRVG